MSKPIDYSKPLVGKNGRRYPSPSDRFWSKVDKSGPDGCWLWTAKIEEAGYGRFFLNGKSVYAHRFAYELVKGPIPEGLTVDHLCRVRHCCNPDHLEAVTLRENLLRGESVSAKNARKTHCIHGHEFTTENTYYSKEGKRHCKACYRIWKTENKDSVRASQRRWIEKNRDLHNYRMRVARKRAKAAAQPV